MCEDLEDLDLNMGHRGMGMEYPGTGKIQASGSPISLETAKVSCPLKFDYQYPYITIIIIHQILGYHGYICTC